MIQLAFRGSILGLVAVAACSGEVMHPRGNASGGAGSGSNTGVAGDGIDNPTGVGTGAGGSTGSPTGDSTGISTGVGTGTGGVTGEQVTGAAGMFVTGKPPADSCNGTLPGSYVTLCSACHTQGGAANSRYPDLFQFMGTEATFAAQVRNGSKNMAPYPAGLISDGDISAIFKYFTGAGGKRPTLDTINLGGVIPLFSATDAKNGPIVFKRDDGAIVTRGAGRVRGRHEKEGSFGQFLENYFDNRTYGFIEEDFTNTATKHIKSTYFPVSMPDHTGNRITNWRHWKLQGNNATFALNDYMKDGTMADAPMAPTGQTAMIQYFDDKQPPGGRQFAIGQNFEFEIGIFIAKDALTTPGSRDSYYTDCFRLQIGVGGLTANNLDYDQLPGPTVDARLGGDTTISWLVAEPYNNFGEMALNIQQENIQNFVGGRRLFHTDFATGKHSDAGNPALTSVAGFAGPKQNTNSCESCHFRNGPGVTLTGNLDATSSMVFKLAAGGQIHQQDGSAAAAAGTTKTVMLGDGTSVTLTKPSFTVTSKTAGTPAFSARIARKLIGNGLLEAIDERTILLRSDALDCNKDGISGRPNFIVEPKSNALRVGRMGWKAEKVSVMHQVADAAQQDLDVGTSLLPDSQGKAEMSDADLLKLTTYMRLVAVPPQRNATNADVVKGNMIFKTVGCANCHVTDVVTGANHPFSELRNQSIRPFTDLLLHDMGPDLADNSGIKVAADGTGPAADSEWRTPPLWGIGMLKTIDPTHTGLLHDGRAKSPLEAVLWHGGEAEKVKAAFIALPAGDRAALLAFLDSI
jgi:CxxC motif-containing protein (DUF1111 family)